MDKRQCKFSIKTFYMFFYILYLSIKITILKYILPISVFGDNPWRRTREQATSLRTSSRFIGAKFVLPRNLTSFYMY